MSNTELKNINNIFPLIDDPMNIFYSKIKQWLQLNTNFHLHCKAKSRVDRIVECSFNGISRVYTCKFKTYNLLKEEDIGHYLYIRYTFVASSRSTQELSTSGENIPVDINDLYLLEDSPKPAVLHNHNEVILYQDATKPTDNKPHYYVYIRVNKVYKTDYSCLDIENTEIDYDELHFEDAYHQSIGRLWVLREIEQPTPPTPGPVTLPTVSITNDFINTHFNFQDSTQNWVEVSETSEALTRVELLPNIDVNAYINTESIPYNSSKGYGVVKWENEVINPTETGAIELSVVNSNNKIAFRNITENAIKAIRVRIAVCSSNNVTVVQVRNSYNVKFNSFKYIANGTSYYFVLDAIQTTWVTDLSTIGYTSLEEVVNYYCELDNHYAWRLYNIDSENNYTLIDKSHTSPTLFGASIMWSAQYGPGIDHRASFTFTQSKSVLDNHHPYIQMTPGEYWVEIRESNWSSDPQLPIVAKIFEEAEPFLSTRGIVPSLFPSLFSGLSFYYANNIPHNKRLNIEGLILLISYIVNINVRYLLCSVNNSPLNQFAESLPIDRSTPNYLLEAVNKDETYAASSGMDCYNSMDSIVSANLQSYAGYDLGKVSYSCLSESVAGSAPNYNRIKAAFDSIVTNPEQSTLSISQNNLPNNIFPHVRWYLHQWVYALSFKKYAPFLLDALNQKVIWKFKDHTETFERVFINWTFFKNNFLG